jgi:hypothetical protein
MATKPTAEEAAMRILWLMMHKFERRENGAVHLGQFGATFAGGRFQAADFEAGATHALSLRWIEDAMRGGLPAYRLTRLGFEQAPEIDEDLMTVRRSMPMSSEAKALRLLEAIYDLTLNRAEPVFVSKLAPDLGMPEEEAQAAWRYLSEKGLIKTFNIPYTARINAYGSDKIENARRSPDQPVAEFGSATYNIIHIHHMERSSIQQAGAQSSVTETISYSNQDFDDLRRAVNLLAEHLDELDLDVVAK